MKLASLQNVREKKFWNIKMEIFYYLNVLNAVRKSSKPHLVISFITLRQIVYIPCKMKGPRESVIQDV